MQAREAESLEAQRRHAAKLMEQQLSEQEREARMAEFRRRQAAMTAEEVPLLYCYLPLTSCPCLIVPPLALPNLTIPHDC
jgi:hypothetical protein